MAAKPKQKPKIVAKPAAKPARKPAAGKPPPAEHKVAVIGIALIVGYGRDRVEEYELRGTALLNAGSEAAVRTTGLVRLIARRGKATNAATYTPAALDRNLVLTLYADPADLALLREVFITGTGSESSDPSLVITATTARPLTADAPDTQAVTEFAYRLDFDQGPAR